MTPKARAFWPLLLILFVTDCTTKDIAIDRLDPTPISQTVIDPYVRLTLVHNPGAAFGFSLEPFLGTWARPALILAMVAILAVLVRLYWTTAPRARMIPAALGMIAGGAVGNLLDRVRNAQGVVDFIDVGVATNRFWVCNVADIGITIGAVLLAVMLVRGEAESAGAATLA